MGTNNKMSPIAGSVPGLHAAPLVPLTLGMPCRKWRPRQGPTVLLADGTEEMVAVRLPPAARDEPLSLAVHIQEEEEAILGGFALRCLLAPGVVAMLGPCRSCEGTRRSLPQSMAAVASTHSSSGFLLQGVSTVIIFSPLFGTHFFLCRMDQKKQ